MPGSAAWLVNHVCAERPAEAYDPPYAHLAHHRTVLACGVLSPVRDAIPACNGDQARWTMCEQAVRVAAGFEAAQNWSPVPCGMQKLAAYLVAAQLEHPIGSPIGSPADALGRHEDAQDSAWVESQGSTRVAWVPVWHVVQGQACPVRRMRILAWAGIEAVSCASALELAKATLARPCPWHPSVAQSHVECWLVEDCRTCA